MSAPPRVLVVHNFYRSENASGENLSVQDEIRGLRRRGWDVEVLSADSDVIADGLIPVPELALRPIYSRRSVERTREAVRRFRPDVALVENLFPLHSPAVIRVLHRAGVPVAAGVRSYRMWCSRSTMFRDGAECRDCMGSLVNAPAVLHGCYQNRPTASVPMALGLAIHRRTWHLVDQYMAVSEFVRRELINFGISPDRVTVRENFVADGGRSTSPGDGFIFAGRLSEEKGIDMLLEAWERSEAWRTSSLTIAGGGPAAGRVAAAPPHLRVEFAGFMAHAEVLERVRRAAVTVVPSLWSEPFGRGVAEAASMSRASLVTDRGGLPELVEDGTTGWVCAPDVASFADGIRSALDASEQIRRGQKARAVYERRFAPARSLDVLHGVLAALAADERGSGLGQQS